MPINNEDFHTSLYDLLRTKGYDPIPLDSKGNTTPFYPEADIFKFSFVKDGKKYGDVWATVDNALKLVLYYDDAVSSSPDDNTSGTPYSDSWPALIKHLKKWAQRRQLSFELKNKDHLVSDMAQREYMKKKERLGEGYYPMGKKASYNDAIPQVKIVIQHTKQIGEGEQRFRNVDRIFVENTEGERFAVPTKKTGLAKVYARHVAEGGTPYDDRGRHLTTLIEEYNKMVGFVRATKSGEFNESVQRVVNAGIDHYQSLRESLGKLTSHRGYHNYFDSWSPVLNEEQSDITEISTLFTKSNLDPRIESCIPILSKLTKLDETKPVKELDSWADEVIRETTSIDLSKEGPTPLMPGAGKNTRTSRERDRERAKALSHYSKELAAHHYGNELNKSDQGVAEGLAPGQAAWKKEMIAKGAVSFKRDQHGGGAVDRIIAYDKDGNVVGGFNRKGVAEGAADMTWHGSNSDMGWYDAYKDQPVRVKVKNHSGLGSNPSGTFNIRSFKKIGPSKAELTIISRTGEMTATVDLDNPETVVTKKYDRVPAMDFYIGSMPSTPRQAFNLFQYKNKQQGMAEAVWDRPSQSYVPRDGRTFGQTNHPREEHCDSCGAATGHAGPGEDSNVDDEGNVYCDDCYADKQGMAEGSKQQWEVSFDYGPHMSDRVIVTASTKEEAAKKGIEAAKKQGHRYPMINWARPVKQGVAEGFQKGDRVTITKHGPYMDPRNAQGIIHSDLLHGDGTSDAYGTKVPNGPYHKVKTRMGIMHTPVAHLKKQGVAEGRDKGNGAESLWKHYVKPALKRRDIKGPFKTTLEFENFLWHVSPPGPMADILPDIFFNADQQKREAILQSINNYIKHDTGSMSETSFKGVAEGEVVEFSLPKAIQNLALEWVEYTFLEDGPEQKRIKNELSKKGFGIDFSDDGNALLLTHSKTGKEFLVQIPEKTQELAESWDEDSYIERRRARKHGYDTGLEREYMDLEDHERAMAARAAKEKEKTSSQEHAPDDSEDINEEYEKFTDSLKKLFGIIGISGAIGYGAWLDHLATYDTPLVHEIVRQAQAGDPRAIEDLRNISLRDGSTVELNRLLNRYGFRSEYERRKPEDTHEGLNAQQKAAGQLGPTEKAKNISPVLGSPQHKHPFDGKLVGNESADPDLKRLQTLIKHIR